MKCADVLEFLHAYLDDEFDERDRLEFEMHVARCAECRAEVDFYRELRRSLRRNLPPALAPVGLEARVRQALVEEQRRSWRRIYHPLAAAAVFLVLLSGVMLWPQRTSRPLFGLNETIRHHKEVVFKARSQRLLKPLRLRPVSLVQPDESALGGPFCCSAERPYTPIVQQQLPHRRVHRFLRPRLALVTRRHLRIAGSPATQVVYRAQGRPLSLLVYHQRIALPQGRLTRRRVGKREVYIGKYSGYNVVFWKEAPSTRRAVQTTYALTSDLDSQQLIRFVDQASLHSP